MSATDASFPRWMFRGAAIYGVLALLPMYALRPSADRPDTYYGFVGCALVFQWLFWIIGSDPARFRRLMVPSVAEKLVFAIPALWLFAQGRVAVGVVPFAIMDLLLGAGFLVARSRIPA